jgi:iron complex outermembrane receptor protein
VSDRVRTRVSLASFERDGHVVRLSDGGRMGGRDQLAGRLVTEFDASDRLTFALALDGTRTREEAAALDLLALDEAGLFPVAHNILGNGASCAPGVPGRDSNPLCYTSQWLTESPYATWASDRNESEADVWGAALTATWRTPRFTVKSITAYRDLESRFFLEADGSPLDVANSGNDYSQDQLSQEIQLTGESSDGRTQWLAGLYAMRERGRDVNTLQWAIGGGISGGVVENDSRAAFAQLTRRFGDSWSLTAGIRYTDEDKRFTPEQYLTAFDPTVSAILFGAGLTNLSGGPLVAGDRLLPLVEVKATASEFTPAVTLDYRFDEHAFAYATYSRGFKSGGFTQRVFPPLPTAPSFAPEFVDNYEVGLKSELLDRRLRLNAALFYMKYTDLQITVTRFLAPTIENAGEARSRGVELELETLLSDRVRFAAGIGYTDAEYRRVPVNAAPVTPNSRLPNAPEWTANAAFVAELVRGTAGTLTLNADWTYRGEHYKDAANTAALRQGGYGLVGASLDWTSTDERWSLRGGATNLGDVTYLVTGNADPGGGGYVYGVVSRPREWFLDLGYRFR